MTPLGAPTKDKNDRLYEGEMWDILVEKVYESHYNDLSNTGIKFPTHKLYGRDQELGTLAKLYFDVAKHALSCPRSKAEKTNNNHSSSCATHDRDNTLSMPHHPQEGSTKSLCQGKVSSGAKTSTQVVFLAGYSGVGKSALVSELIKKIKKEKIIEDSQFLHAVGKYSNLRSTSAPFSGLVDAFQNLTTELLNIDRIKDKNCDRACLLTQIRTRIKKSKIIGSGTEGDCTLQNAFRGLIPLLNQTACNDLEPKKAEPMLSSGQELSPTFRINVMKESVREIVGIISSSVEYPLLLVLDDLQWADEPSLDILNFILSDKTLQNAFFICNYRSNEVNPGDPFHHLMETIDDVRLRGSESMSSVKHIELFNLTPLDINRFIADSLNKDPDGVLSITEVIYEKTIGNIFYVKQAIEQLVRENALYYDVMDFEWQWNVSRIELESFLAQDVVGMVKSKIHGLPREIQVLLLLMALIPKTVDATTLRQLMCESDIHISIPGMKKILHKSVAEGMLVTSDCGKSYSFAHDRIREASYTFIPEGDRRHKLAVLISNVLIDQGSIPENEWMLFVAVDNLNSVPPRQTGDIDVAELNVRVAKIAMQSGASSKANELFHSAIKSLDSRGQKWEDYDFTLDLYNNVIKTEYSLGGFDRVDSAIREVFNNARSLNDKLNAYIFQIKCIGEGNNRNYISGSKEAVKVLGLCGIRIPFSPSKMELLNEKIRLKSAVRNRSLTFLAELPCANSFDISFFHIFSLLARYSLYSRNIGLLKISSQRAIRLTIQKGICSYTALIILFSAGMYSREGDVKTGYALGIVASKLSDLFRHDKENFAFCQAILYGGILTHLVPFRDGIDKLIPAHMDLKLAGNVDSALASGVNFINAYLICGFPLNSIFDRNLVVLEEYSKSIGILSYISLFQSMMQFVSNVRKQSANPTEFKGEIFYEAETLGKMEGNGKSMTLRDITIFRLVLAFVFADESCMEEMIKRLDNYPTSDPLTSRTHLRVGFAGLAALILGKKNNQSYLELARTSYEFFERLSKEGSLSARPFYLLLEAMKMPDNAKFDEAIECCAEYQILHLEAIANEHCGHFLEKENKPELARQYITNSYMLYREWGAFAKSRLLLESYDFLKRPTLRRHSNKYVSVLKTRKLSFNIGRQRCDHGLSHLIQSKLVLPD